MKKWLLLAGAIVSEVTASLALQAAQDHPAWYVVVGVGYVATFSLLGLSAATWNVLLCFGLAVFAKLSALVHHKDIVMKEGDCCCKKPKCEKSNIFIIFSSLWKQYKYSFKRK